MRETSVAFVAVCITISSISRRVGDRTSRLHHGLKAMLILFVLIGGLGDIGCIVSVRMASTQVFRDLQLVEILGSSFRGLDCTQQRVSSS